MQNCHRRPETSQPCCRGRYAHICGGLQRAIRDGSGGQPRGRAPRPPPGSCQHWEDVEIRSWRSSPTTDSWPPGRPVHRQRHSGVHAIQPRRSPLGAASGISGHDGSYGLTSTTAGAAIRCSLSARRRDHGSMRISISTPSIMRRDEMVLLRTRRMESTASARRSVVRSHCCRNADSAALFSGLFISATSRRAISGSFTAQSGSEIRRASKLISSGAMNSRRARNSRTSPASISATGRPRPQASTAAITAS